MKTKSKLNWLKDKEREFRKTGKLDISGEMLENLSFIGSRPTMKTLDLSFTSIKSLEGLPPQPKLEYLILDGSTIESFKNGFSISSISKISIRNTPISKIPNYKISLLLICDKNLRIIDDRIIPSKLKQKAEKYPPICRKLVNQGWIAEYPCPSESDLIEICFKYGLSYQEETQNKNLNNLSEIPLFEEKDIDEMISKYSSKHQKMLEKAKAKLENYEDITTNPYNSNYNTSIDLNVTSESSIANSNTEFTEEVYTFNANENYQDDFIPNDEEMTESFLSYNPNLLSFRVREVIKRYGFDVGDDGDPIETIIPVLTQIFQIAEGKDIDFPHVLMDGNAIAIDDDFEEDEEESFLSEDFNISPKKPKTNVTFDLSNHPNNPYKFLEQPNNNSEVKESSELIQIESSDHLINEYNEEEENKIDIGNKNNDDEDEIEKEKDQKKDLLDSDSMNSISAIDGDGQINDSLFQQGLILSENKEENEKEFDLEEEEVKSTTSANLIKNIEEEEEEDVKSSIFKNLINNEEEEARSSEFSELIKNMDADIKSSEFSDLVKNIEAAEEELNSGYDENTEIHSDEPIFLSKGEEEE